MAAKEEGNDHFKQQNYPQAVECYSCALSLCPPPHPQAAIFLKNRAQCWLNLESYEKALLDSVAALEISPSDVKALYRHAQALEKTGKMAEAFRQVQTLLRIDPQKKEAVQMARRLTVELKKQADSMQSTDTMVREMLAALSTLSTPLEKQVKAAKNLAILSREVAGAEKIFAAGGVGKLIEILETGSVPELLNHTLQTLVGLCSGHRARAFVVLQTVSLERLSALMASAHSNVASSAVAILKHAILATTGEDIRSPHNAESALVTVDTAVIVPVIQMLLISLISRDVSADARDYIIELLLRTIPQASLGEIYMREGLTGRLLLLAAETSGVKARDGVALKMSAECRMNVSMVLSTLFEALGRDKQKKELQDKFCKDSSAFVLSLLSKEDPLAHIRGLTALAALIQGVAEVGNAVFGDESVLKKALAVATSDDPACQMVVAEVLALAASDKDRCHGIIQEGLPVLKELYAAPDDRVKVRALVGLCKLGSVGGGNVNARTFAEGSTVKLEKACRKFLVNTARGDILLKWAAEGMAFLTLDAAVKEAFIEDRPALTALLKLAKTTDHSLQFGIATILVNVSNSYDKPERNKELEELGRYAGENIPKEHEWDGEEHVKKRVKVLLELQVIPVLIELGTSESNTVHEQISRVFLALCEEVAHRGTIIQQGGAKTLVILAHSNTTKGKLVAAHALAKLGITNDPKLAFPGQRCLEIVRPLVTLLRADHGLMQFEGLMALTNLASMSDDVRHRILKEGGVGLMESLMFEEQELIRRAATEALCNMIYLDEVAARFQRSDDIERVKLWTLFSGEDDERLAIAASGGLSILSRDPKICEQIMAVKSAMEILKELVTSSSEDLQFRGMYIVANLVESGKETAIKIMECELLEVCMAYSQGDFPDRVKESARRALSKAIEFGVIQPNPDLPQN